MNYVNFANKLAFPLSAIHAARHYIQQMIEASWTDLSWGLKHDEHGDISKPSGKNQEIDIDLMSTHATMKTTRNTTQNAFCWPCHVLLGTGPKMTLKEAFQPLPLSRSQKTAALWASSSWLIWIG